MSEPSIVNVLVAVNTVLLAVVGFFFSRLISSLDAVTKRMQEIEITKARMQSEMEAIAEKIAHVVRLVSIPDRMERVEDEIEQHASEISTLRERQHDLANAVNGVVHAHELGVKLQPIKLKEWPK